MLIEHFSKINIGLATVVIICFFLPWVNIDCGNITFLQLSGFQLTTGKVSLDKSAMQQFSQQLGQDAGTLEMEESQQARPQIYLAVILICAGGIIAYSVRMLSEFNQVRSIAIVAFGSVGLLILLLGMMLNFGLDIPADAAMLIQTSYTFPFYLTLLSYICSIVLTVLGIRASAVSSEETPSIEIPSTASPTAQSMDINDLSLEMNASTMEFIDFEKPASQSLEQKKPVQSQAQRPKAPPGAKTCPSCGAVVGTFQTKCLKCGTKLKPGK